MDLRDAPTYNLVEELKMRDYVRVIYLDPESYEIGIEGPAVVLIVED